MCPTIERGGNTGGEGGIRTLGKGYPLQQLSRLPPSATRSPLRNAQNATSRAIPPRSPFRHAICGTARCVAEGGGLEPPRVLTRRFSRPLPYQLGLALHKSTTHGYHQVGWKKYNCGPSRGQHPRRRSLRHALHRWPLPVRHRQRYRHRPLRPRHRRNERPGSCR
jgi:hypothetical protein